TLEPLESDALRRVEPPTTIRVTAPPAIAPAAAVDPDWLVDHFHQTRDRYCDCVRRATGLDLAGVLITRPIHPPIRTLGGALLFLAAHDRRHIWQAAQVRNAVGFPRSLLESRHDRPENPLTSGQMR